MGGALAPLTAADLATHTLRALVERSSLGEGDVDDVILGNGYASGEAPAIGRIAALDAGELTIDQAGEIARNVPARYEASAARVARHATVAQLRTTLPAYRHPKPTDRSPRKQRREVATGVDEHGWWARLRLPAVDP